MVERVTVIMRANLNERGLRVGHCSWPTVADAPKWVRMALGSAARDDGFSLDIEVDRRVRPWKASDGVGVEVVWRRGSSRRASLRKVVEIRGDEIDLDNGDTVWERDGERRLFVVRDPYLRGDDHD